MYKRKKKRRKALALDLIFCFVFCLLAISFRKTWTVKFIQTKMEVLSKGKELAFYQYLIIFTRSYPQNLEL